MTGESSLVRFEPRRRRPRPALRHQADAISDRYQRWMRSMTFREWSITGIPEWADPSDVLASLQYYRAVMADQIYPWLNRRDWT